MVAEVTIVVNSENLSRQSLDLLLDRIHDHWFDLGQIRLDEATNLLTIPFGNSRRGPFDGEIRIRGVREYEIEDGAQIGVYDINEIRADPPKIVLTSGFPLRLTFDVGDIWEISAEEATDTP
jgi:hypothetical protein